MRTFLTALLLLGSCAAVPSALAHQTYAVSGDGAVFVANPGKGALYVRALTGQEQSFEFDGATPFSLRARLLVPDGEEQPRDVRASLVSRDGPDAAPIALLAPGTGSWSERVVDAKTGRAYRVGSHVARELPAGRYAIRVSSPGNDSAYALLFGTMDGEEPLPVAEASGDLSTRDTMILAGILVAFALGILFHIQKRATEVAAVEAEAQPEPRPKAPRRAPKA